jgi:4-amino-4-deoxy-L-arabinose transferase-like glycosyltransferase
MNAARRWAAAWARLRAVFDEPPVSRDALAVTALGFAVRLAVVAWAGRDFPPADDGKFYHVVAERIAAGHGYTWLWPDGAVTYAAHYPVGYPALLGGLYALFGADVRVAMLFNAALGALAVWAVYDVASTVGRRGPALLAGAIAALHPGFVFYTPALMTEGVTAALFAVLAALATRARTAPSSAGWRWLGLGVVSGVLTLIRPQTIVLAPLFGAFAGARTRRRALGGAALVTAVALAVCLPWTLRNCERLERCVFVSANGGWNLFIGSAEKATGRWVALEELGVPAECREVFAEAEKDRCFGRAGLENVARAPFRFLSLVPKKLAATFDWWGAAGHYLHTSNGSRFPYEHKLALGVTEAIIERLVVLLGLAGVARAPGKLPRLRRVLALFGAVWLFREHAYVALCALVLATVLGGSRLLERPGAFFGAAVVTATALTHAVFFGDGRYGLVTGLVLVMLAAEAFHRDNQPLFRRAAASG